MMLELKASLHVIIAYTIIRKIGHTLCCKASGVSIIRRYIEPWLIMIEVSVIFMLLLLMGKSIDSGSTGLSRDLESEWDELFGHLSFESIPSTLPVGYSNLGKHGQSKISSSKDTPKIHGKEKNSTITTGSLKPKPRPPAPPAAPFVYNPEDPEKIPNIGAQSLGSMEGIAISQNGATSIGMFIMNSSYNSFSTLFGSSQNTQTQPKALKFEIT